MSSRSKAAAIRRREQNRKQWLWGGVAVIIMVALIAALMATSGDKKADAGPQTHAVTVAGASLPTFELGAADPAVGSPIPSVEGTTLDGKPIEITNDGKAKVILFVAHWCPHCQKEVPLLAPDLRENPLPDGVEMYTVSTGVNKQAPNYPPSKWLDGVQWPTPVMADDDMSTAAQAFGLGAYPYFVFVDANNEVVARTSGEIPLSEFRDHVNALASTA